MKIRLIQFAFVPLAAYASTKAVQSSDAMDALKALLHPRCLISKTKENLSGHHVDNAEAIPVDPAVGSQFFKNDISQMVELSLRPVKRARWNWRASLKQNDLTRLMHDPDQSLSYFEDISGRLFVSDQPIEGELPALIHNTDPKGKDEIIVLKEAGTMSYNKKTKKFDFKAQYHGAKEVDESKVRDPATQAARENPPAKDPSSMSKDEIVSCDQFNEINSHGASYFISKIGADASFQTASMFFTGRFETPAGARSWEAGVGWIGSHDLLSSGADYFLVKGGTSIPLALGVKYLDAIAEWFMADRWNQLVMGKYDTGKHSDSLSEFRHMMLKSVGLSHEDESKKSSAQRIADANFQYSLIRTPVGYAIDRWFINSLPALTMKLCSINPKLLMIVNSTSLRFLDRASNQMMQVSFQNWILGDAFKKNPKTKQPD